MPDRVPETSSRFVGNARILERLEDKLKARRLPHAMIFSGPEGIGKRTCALRIARMLNCEQGGGASCGRCRQCRKVESGSHPDVFTIQVAADASRIKIEQVRNLLSMLNMEPMEGAAKLFLIDPAERMSPGASTALLKALEEPPPRTYFILITQNVHDLLVTIRSRSQIYHFSPLTLDEIRRCGIEDELVVRWSQGSIGRALGTDADSLRKSRAAMLEFLETAMHAREEELAGLLTLSAELGRAKEDYTERLRILGVLVSDLIFLCEGIDDRIVNIDIETRLRESASHVAIERLIQIADCLKFIEANLKYYLNKQLMADVLALTLNETTAKILNQNPSI